MSMSRSTVRPARTYFDHIDHDCDSIKLKDANGPLIVAKDHNDCMVAVELSLDDLRALNDATAKLLLDHAFFAEPPRTGKSTPVPESATDEPEPTAADIRRAAALALAKETLGAGMHPPEALLTLADWLLGNTDPAEGNTAQQLAELQQKLGRRANG